MKEILRLEHSDKLRFGVTQCVEIVAGVTHLISHEDGIKNKTIFKCVDAHALQHPEIHGR